MVGLKQRRKLQNLHILTIVEDYEETRVRWDKWSSWFFSRPSDRRACGVQVCREISEKSGRDVALTSVYVSTGLLLPKSEHS
jgi:hypothetical protein